MSKCVNTAGCGDRGLSRNPAIVRGNDFTLEAHVSVYDASKGFYVPVDLSAATEVSLAVVGRYGKAGGRDINATGDKVTARFAGSLSAGPYGVEVLFKDTSGRGRIFERDLFAVVDDSSDATAGTASEGGDGEGYNISVDVRSRVLRIGRAAMVSDYGQLSNKPSIGGVVLEGDKSPEELGISAEALIVTIDLEHPNEDGSYTPSHTPQEIRQAFLGGKAVFFDVPPIGLRTSLAFCGDGYSEFVGHMHLNSGETTTYHTFWYCLGDTVNMDDIRRFDQFTASESKKLLNIENNAQKNVQPDWAESDTKKDSFIKNKPAKLSQFTNDKDFATKSEISDVIRSYDCSWILGDTISDKDYNEAVNALSKGYVFQIEENSFKPTVMVGSVSGNDPTEPILYFMWIVGRNGGQDIRLIEVRKGSENAVKYSDIYLSDRYDLTLDLEAKQDKPTIKGLTNSSTVNVSGESDKLYSGTFITTLTIAAAKADNSQNGVEEVFIFSTGTAPAIAVTGVSWANSDTPTFEAGKTYEIHILYNATLDKFLATYAVYE